MDDTVSYTLYSLYIHCTHIWYCWKTIDYDCYTSKYDNQWKLMLYFHFGLNFFDQCEWNSSFRFWNYGLFSEHIEFFSRPFLKQSWLFYFTIYCDSIYEICLEIFIIFSPFDTISSKHLILANRVSLSDTHSVKL